MGAPPDFFMRSRETSTLISPRKCWSVKKIRTQYRSDLLLARIDPPIVHEVPRADSVSIDYVVLGAMLQGESVLLIKNWPIHVYVGRLIDPEMQNEEIDAKNIETIAWAELFPP